MRGLIPASILDESESVIVVLSYQRRPSLRSWSQSGLLIVVLNFCCEELGKMRNRRRRVVADNIARKFCDRRFLVESESFMNHRASYKLGNRGVLGKTKRIFGVELFFWLVAYF